jgi:hypothetical protein
LETDYYPSLLFKRNYIPAETVTFKLFSDHNKLLLLNKMSEFKVISPDDCVNCGITVKPEEQHASRLCRECGGKVKSICELCKKEDLRGCMFHLSSDNLYLCKSCSQLPDVRNLKNKKCYKCKNPVDYPYTAQWKAFLGFYHYDCDKESKQTCCWCKKEYETKEMKYYRDSHSYACYPCVEADKKKTRVVLFQHNIPCCRKECNVIIVTINSVEEKKPVTLQCPKCLKTDYCSQDCLQKDKEYHSKYCRPVLTPGQERTEKVLDFIQSKPENIKFVYNVCSSCIGENKDKFLVIDSGKSFSFDPFEFSGFPYDIEKEKANLSTVVKDIDKVKEDYYIIMVIHREEGKEEGEVGFSVFRLPRD